MVYFAKKTKNPYLFLQKCSTIDFRLDSKYGSWQSCQKSHLKDISLVMYNFLCLYFYYACFILFCHTNQKNVLLKEINDWTFEVYFHPVLDSRWLSHWKWLVRDPMRGSWIFCQTEVWIVFCGLMSWPNAEKQLWPAQISKIERVGSIMTGPK